MNSEDKMLVTVVVLCIVEILLSFLVVFNLWMWWVVFIGAVNLNLMDKATDEEMIGALALSFVMLCLTCGIALGVMLGVF